MKVWEELLTDRDRRVIANGGYGRTRGLGSRPVLMVIDCQYNYIGDDRPVDEQQDTWPAGGGAAAWSAIRRISPMLRQARKSAIPVIYTRNVQKRTVRFDSFAGKSTWDKSRSLDDSPGSAIVTEIAPDDDSLVIDKSYASAFYGTPLMTYLIGLEADTLILCGVSTGGCVRASAVDAASRGFKIAVVEDAVADRIEASHKVALLDLWMKYTDVMASDDVITYLEGQGHNDG